MSRAKDLWNKAAAKASSPFRRIYFDTQALNEGHWPRASAQMRVCMHFANLLNVALVIPQPVLDERGAQWMRQAIDKRDEAIKANQSFVDFLASYIESDDVEFRGDELASKDDLWEG